MPKNSNTVVRAEVEVAGRIYDRSSAIARAQQLITQGASLPKEMAVFLREDNTSKKALTLARAGRKQHLVNHGFTLITEAQSRGFKVIGMTAPKKGAKSGDESFTVRLQKPGKDGRVHVTEIKSKLQQMSKSERNGLLAELAALQSDKDLIGDGEIIEMESQTAGAIAPAEATVE